MKKENGSTDTLVLIDSASFAETTTIDTTITDTTTDSTGATKTLSQVDSTPLQETTTTEPKTSNTTLRTVVLSIVGITSAVVLLLFIVYIIAKKLWAVITGKSSIDGHKNFLTRTRISIMDSEVQLVCTYIESHYNDSQLSPESVCKALTTGLSFVETLFRRELDMSLAEFITHVRIHHALGHINNGFEGSVEKLAILCGYEDTSRFALDFRSVTLNELSAVMNR